MSPLEQQVAVRVNALVERIELEGLIVCKRCYQLMLRELVRRLSTRLNALNDELDRAQQQ